MKSLNGQYKPRCFVPKTYEWVLPLEDLEHEDLRLVTDSSEIDTTLDLLGFPKRYRKDITGIVLLIGDGYNAVWLSESVRPYDLRSAYRALPFYRPVRWAIRKLPTYWKETCAYYQRYCYLFNKENDNE